MSRASAEVAPDNFVNCLNFFAPPRHLTTSFHDAVASAPCWSGSQRQGELSQSAIEQGIGLCECLCEQSHLPYIEDGANHISLTSFPLFAFQTSRLEDV